MIERVFVKDYLSLKNISLEFEEGLMAFTGPSGAGKSIFMQALLSLFGLKEANAKVVEASLNMPLVGLEEVGIDADEPNILKCMKDKNVRYFINNQALSKKNMQQICGKNIRYLSLREVNEFTSASLLELLDGSIKDKTYQNLLKKYRENFDKYTSVKSELEKIEDEEKKVNELKEFARFEIEAIDAIDPKVGEDKELLDIKKSLSKKEKIIDAMQQAKGIFEYENSVTQLLNILEIDSNFFDECMNELRVYLDEGGEKLELLDDVDIESVLKRLEDISKLKSRFGDSIEEIIKHKQKRSHELKRYENISFEKKRLQEDFEKLKSEVLKLSSEITAKRKKALKPLENMLNGYLKKMYLNEAKLHMQEVDFASNGANFLEVKLDNTDIKKVSSGELNRIRLAFIACKNEIFSSKNGGVLILDEVDANLSGKEAYSVASVIKQIAKNYQVLAISHQPQLSSVANVHFLVQKNGDTTHIKKLEFDDRVKELARMVSGEDIKSEALEFAKKLLQEQD